MIVLVVEWEKEGKMNQMVPSVEIIPSYGNDDGFFLLVNE